MMVVCSQAVAMEKVFFTVPHMQGYFKVLQDRRELLAAGILRRLNTVKKASDKQDDDAFKAVP
jgi:hypothetical protein